jgi:hypothetical protein
MTVTAARRRHPRRDHTPGSTTPRRNTIPIVAHGFAAANTEIGERFRVIVMVAPKFQARAVAPGAESTVPAVSGLRR